ncbi:hypothetical protein KP509_04G042000 [Ceratopteris richardii]|nr:hypothetical protein KP509_04G042000 [Ceratopteris richardii]
MVDHEQGLLYVIAMAIYVMMGCAIFVAYEFGSPFKKKTLLGLYIVQLSLNLLWLLLAFGMQNVEGALVDSVLLLISVILCTQQFGIAHKISGYLMLPYSICTHVLVAYSTHLYVLNRKAI